MVIHPAACMAKKASSSTQVRGFFLSVSCSLSVTIQSNNRSEQCQFETPGGKMYDSHSWLSAFALPRLKGTAKSGCPTRIAAGPFRHIRDGLQFTGPSLRQEMAEAGFPSHEFGRGNKCGFTSRGRSRWRGTVRRYALPQ